MKISFIGFGNMAQGIARALSDNSAYQLFAASPSLSKGSNSAGVITDSDNLEVIRHADIVVLAVKPVRMTEVLKQIGLVLPSHCLLISVAAGISLSWLEKKCRNSQAIIRTMPNTPIAVGKGATALIANKHVTNEHRQWAERLFQDSGIVHWTTKESDMNAFTALSGSGPAYLFLFMEAMIDAAKKLGLSEEVAKTFTLQTVDGALSLAARENIDIRELRKKVTSPAGTTAAALDILQQHGFSELLFTAMKAACERAQQLSL